MEAGKRLKGKGERYKLTFPPYPFPFYHSLESPMPHDATCSTWGDSKTAATPPCPMPHAQIKTATAKSAE